MVVKKKHKVPTKLQVIALMDKTNESYRKCYFWLLQDLNKPKKERTPLIRSISLSGKPLVESVAGLSVL